VHANAKVFQNDIPTTRTRPTGVTGVHRDYFDPSLDSLVVEQFAEHSQADIVRGQRETAVVEHEAERQVLQDKRAVGGHKPPRDLVPEVPTLVGDTFVQSGQSSDGLPPIAATPLLSSQRPLENPKTCQRCSQVARAVDDRSVRKCQGVRDTLVYSNGRVGTDSGLHIRRHDLQTHIPTGRLANDDDVLEVPFRECSVPPYPHLSDVLDVKPSILKRRTITGLEGNAVEEVETTEARAAALAFDELQVGAVQTTKDLLTGAHVQETQGIVSRAFVSPIPPHPCLLIVADASAAFIPPLTSVGERVVVEGTGSIENVLQGRLVGLVGIETVAVGADHLRPPLLGFDVPLDCGGRDVPGGADEVGTRPHVWQTRTEFGEILPQLVGREALEPVHDLVGRKRRREGAEKVNVVWLDGDVENLPAQGFRLLSKELAEAHGNPAHQDWPTVLRYPYEVISDVVGGVPCSFGVHNLIMPQKGGRHNSSPR